MSSIRAPRYDCDNCSESSSRSARSCSTPVPSPSPSDCSPSNLWEPRQSSPGRNAWRFESSWESDCISSGVPNAWAESCISSSRCSCVIELSIRCAAAERFARESMSSSTFCGLSGKNCPCLLMKSSKSCWVSSPSRCFSSRLLRSVSISLMAARSSSVAFSIACFMPSNRWSSSSRPMRSLIFS